MEEIYTFAGNPLDRVSQRRKDDAWIASLLDDPATRILPLIDLKPPVRDGSLPLLDWRPVAPWREAIAGGAALIFLGLDAGRARFALDATGTSRDGGARSIDVRTLAAEIDGREAAVLAEARSLLDWHARHRFCAQCGTPTTIAAAGWNRLCPDCKAHHFPRTDPVVIMLAVRGEHALLGRNRRRAGQRFSCLAGFMEPGETPEEAVRREVLEESGVHVGRVRYLAAQPWPFPSTLMMGFLAEAISEEIAIDPVEIAEARWFPREEVRAMLARARGDDPPPDQPTLPPPLAIAHQICRRWANGIDGL